MSDDKNDFEDNSIKCKVVLIGKSGVGKTSIISRYTTNVFKEVLMTTPGANFTSKQVEFPQYKKTIKFEIWDTAGQERYRSLAKVFYNNASACILVYDITRKETFDDIINYWVPEIKENAPKDIILALAGNKSDLEPSKRQVPTSKGKDFAEQNNMIFFETSAKTGVGVKELFRTIAIKEYEIIKKSN